MRKDGMRDEEITPGSVAPGTRKDKKESVGRPVGLVLLMFLPFLFFMTYSCDTTDSTPVYVLSTTVTPEEGGTIQPSGGEYEEGREMELSAEPSENWRFVRWEGDLNGTGSIATLLFNSDKNVTAVFAERNYELVIEIEGEGRVDEEVIEEPAKTEYEHGTTVRLTAVPDDGWRFVGWEGDLEGNENPQTLVVEEEKNVTAVFERLEFSLNIIIDGNGEIRRDPEQDVYYFGDEVILTAEPVDNSRFIEWEGALSGIETEKTIVFDGEELARDITAYFAEIVHPMWAMGYNHNGQLGNGESGPGSDKNVPTQGVQGFFEVEHIAAGGFHSLIVGMDGILMGMGLNEVGQLGDGTFTQRVDPVQISDNVSEASASEFHSLILKRDGSLWVTGRNDYGQLGNGTTETRNTLQEIQSGVTAIVAGDYHSLFIKSDGKLYGMGRNAYGQLGFERDVSEDTTITVVPNPEPVLIEHDREVVQVAAGGGHSLFIDSQGSLYGIGDNSVGQLGLGSDISFTEEPMLIAENVENIATGRDHSLYVQNGDLYGMGSYARGKLGTGNNYNHFEPEFVDSDVNLIAGGLYHSVYVKNDGTLWGMGENARGQLGDGSDTDQHTPVMVDEDVIRVAAGIRHTLFVKD